MLPVKDPASLFRTVYASGEASDSSGSSYRLFLEMQQRTKPLADLMAYAPAAFASVSIANSAAQRLTQQTVSGNYFVVLEVPPELGRMSSREETAHRGSTQSP